MFFGPTKEEISKEDIVYYNIGATAEEYQTTEFSLVNEAAFVVARTINDMLKFDVFDYEDIWTKEMITEALPNIGKPISEVMLTTTDQVVDYIINNSIVYLRNYISNIISAKISMIYSNHPAYITIPSALPKYLTDKKLSSFEHHSELFGKMYGYIYQIYCEDPNDPIHFDCLASGAEDEKEITIVNALEVPYRNMIAQLSYETINYINSCIQSIQNKVNLSNIMPQGPIDLVSWVDPEVEVAKRTAEAVQQQQPIPEQKEGAQQQSVQQEPVQQQQTTEQKSPQVDPMNLSEEEEKAIQTLMNGMFFENLINGGYQPQPAQ
jgi:hypothetical protein